MIVCSCNIITRRDIEAVIERILSDDPYAVLTPNLIYHRLGRRGRCCGCFPQVTDILVEHAIAFRERMERGEVPVFPSAEDAHAIQPLAEVPRRARAS
jgi:bacterioferritin-associated ferredoxin